MGVGGEEKLQGKTILEDTPLVKTEGDLIMPCELSGIFQKVRLLSIPLSCREGWVEEKFIMETDGTASFGLWFYPVREIRAGVGLVSGMCCVARGNICQLCLISFKHVQARLGK